MFDAQICLIFKGRLVDKLIDKMYSHDYIADILPWLVLNTNQLIIFLGSPFSLLRRIFCTLYVHVKTAIWEILKNVLNNFPKNVKVLSNVTVKKIYLIVS